MSTLSAIASALLDAGLDLTAPEVVDVLWFARHIGVDVQAAAANPAESTAIDPLTLPQPAAEPSPDPDVPEDDDNLDDIDALLEMADPAGEEQSTGLHVASGGRGAGSALRSGLGIRVPGVASLSEPLKLARALRPLMRRRPSRTAFVLDEIGTVERIADMRIIVPHMRPAPARWFELALIVDKSASMAVWQSTIQEFRRLLERQGAFRDVRSWGLMTDFTDGVVRLYSGLGPVDPRRTPHKPGELVDPTGRRITLVISDCVSPAWHNGEMAMILAQWQRSGPLAVVQMLPEHLWEATGLGGAADADLTATLPGALNSQLRVSVQALWYERRRTDLAVPIIQLNPRSLRDWSALVMGGAQSRVAGRIFHLPETRADLSEDAPPKDRDADQLVGNFRALVSKQARQLGGVLATIPVLTLPLMRVVQATLLPSTDVTHLAELFIGGILSERQENAHLLDPEIVEYTFVPGVSELLIKSVSSYDAIAALSLFFERRLGRSINFFALLEDPSRAVGLLGLDQESESFAALTAEALRRLGGSFARVAEELERNILPDDSGDQQFELENFQDQIPFDKIDVYRNINNNEHENYELIDRIKYEIRFLRLQKAMFGVYDAPKYIENNISNMESKLDDVLNNTDVNIYRYVDDETLVRLLRNHQLNAIFLNDQIQLHGGEDYAPRILIDRVLVENKEVEMLFGEYKKRDINIDISDINIYDDDDSYHLSSDDNLIDLINIHMKNLRKLEKSKSAYTSIYLPVSVHNQINKTSFELIKIEKEIKHNRNIYSILNIQKNNIINEVNRYKDVDVDYLESDMNDKLQDLYELEKSASIYPPFDIPIYLSNQIDDIKIDIFDILSELRRNSRSILYNIDKIKRDDIGRYYFLDEKTVKIILDMRLSRLMSLMNESKQYTDITMPLYLVNMIEFEEDEVMLLQKTLAGMISSDHH
jgi:hypothetical protein